MTMPQIADDRATLAARAVALARRPQSAMTTGQLLSLVSFRVGNEVFAIEARFVREVIRLRHLSVVPGAPAPVRGVTTYQGEILAVVDLLSARGIEGERLRDALWVLVLGGGTADFGITADELRGSLELGVDSLLSSVGVRGPSGRYIRGTTSGAIAVLDGEALLAAIDIFGSTGGASAPMRADSESIAEQKEKAT